MSGGFSYFLRTGFVNAPLSNGIGRFVQQCNRMTIKFCKSGGGSGGVREFIQNDLVDFARQNPGTVLYLKPRRHRSPVVVAEYLNGHREWMSLHHFSREEVGKWLYHLRSTGGSPEKRYSHYQKTDNPSIQGPWNPFTHKAPEKNLMEFPNEVLAHPSNIPPTTSEIIQEMYGQGKAAQHAS